MIGWLKEKWQRYCKRFRFVVQLDGSAYLIRYRLLQTSRLSIYLHHILRDDADRELHDHPFPFWNMILWGGYMEERFHRDEPGGARITVPRRWLSVGYRPASTAHRVVEVKPNTWTLFIRGQRCRDWGFYDDDGRWTRAIDENQKRGTDVPSKVHGAPSGG